VTSAVLPASSAVVVVMTIPFDSYLDGSVGRFRQMTRRPKASPAALAAKSTALCPRTVSIRWGGLASWPAMIAGKSERPVGEQGEVRLGGTAALAAVPPGPAGCGLAVGVELSDCCCCAQDDLVDRSGVGDHDVVR
jgi:hypothetical protein